MSFAIISGRNNGYPCIPELNEFVSAEENPPYPDFMMRCCPELNEGYPWILKLVTLDEATESSLYAVNKKIIGIFAGSKEIKSAYCREKAVFFKYYVRASSH